VGKAIVAAAVAAERSIAEEVHPHLRVKECPSATPASRCCHTDNVVFNIIVFVVVITFVVVNIIVFVVVVVVVVVEVIIIFNAWATEDSSTPSSSSTCSVNDEIIVNGWITTDSSTPSSFNSSASVSTSCSVNDDAEEAVPAPLHRKQQ
jgi:hypothetical protein